MRTLLTVALLSSVAFSQAPCFETSFGTNLGAGDDVVLPLQPIGFAFPFGGATYTHLHVSTNGFFYLSNGGLPAPGTALCCSGDPARLVDGSPKICPLFTDLTVISAQGSYVYLNSGPASCTVTWDNVKEYGYNIPFDLQCRLQPNGSVRFVYHGEAGVRSSRGTLIGMSAGNGAVIPSASDFSSAGASTAHTVYESFAGSGNGFDLAGAIVDFAPNAASWTWTSRPCSATHTSYGTGCVAVSNTFYEEFAAGAMDLAGTSMRLTNLGTGYRASASSAAYVAPPPTATPLRLFDDGEVNVVLASAMPVVGTTTTFLTVCSNGFVSVGSGNSTQPTPAAVSFLSMGRTVFASWHDYDPSAPGGGQVWFHQAGGIAYVSWQGVFDAQVSGPGSTFQFQFELATGNVNYVWANLSGLGNGHLVGFHPGGLSLDGGNLDLSMRLSTSIQVPNEQQLPLLLEILAASNGGTPPRLGSTIYLYTQHLPLGSPFGVLHLGFTNPDLDLAPSGMPGCRLYVDSFASQTFVPVQHLGTSILSVPFDPSLVGARVLAQSFVYAPAAGLTPLGVIATNGVSMTLGY
jgi:hypothetical protein